MKSKLTEGSCLKTLIGFSLPFLLSYFLQTLYGMADLYIIGRFCGVESTTAVSIGSQVMHMVTVMIVGLAMGCVVTVGQAVGAGDRQRIEKVVGSTVLLFGLLALALTLGMSAAVEPAVNIMSTPEAARGGTAVYLRICFLGIPFIVAYNVIGAVFRGMGDSRSPMYFVAAACVMNILLDFFFIGTMDLGPAGAALGTVLSQAFSVGLSLIVIFRKRKDTELAGIRPSADRKVMGKILKIGLPVALQDGFIQIAFMVITIFANHRGLQDAAAVGIVEKLIGILFLLPSSMLQAVSALSAMNIGAGKEQRARQTLFYGCGIAFLWGWAAVLLMHFGDRAIIGLFSHSDRVVELGCQYMKGYVWDCMFAGIHFCFSGYFCALGLSGLSFLHNALSIVCVRVPLSYFAARYFTDTLFPMGIASPAGSVLSVFICLGAYLWLRRRSKKH